MGTEDVAASHCTVLLSGVFDLVRHRRPGAASASASLGVEGLLPPPPEKKLSFAQLLGLR